MKAMEFDVLVESNIDSRELGRVGDGMYLHTPSLSRDSRFWSIYIGHL